MQAVREKLMQMYQAMYEHFGPQNWWPGDGALEIVIGAVLTQNTNWTNVERAIENLQRENLIDIEKLNNIDHSQLARLIRPAGYFNIKAKRLKNLIKYLWDSYQGDIDKFFSLSIEQMREELLSVSGIGRETADDIILYAANKPTFVIDAYTWRIAHRHMLIEYDADYETIKELFEDNLDADVELFNEYHALLVATGKNYCKRKKPLCEKCPLNKFEHNPEPPEEM